MPITPLGVPITPLGPPGCAHYTPGCAHYTPGCARYTPWVCPLHPRYTPWVCPLHPLGMPAAPPGYARYTPWVCPLHPLSVPITPPGTPWVCPLHPLGPPGCALYTPGCARYTPWVCPLHLISIPIAPTVLENAWKVQDWSSMKEASTQAEPVCSDNYSAKLNLLRGYLALCYPDEQRLNVVEKLIEAASVQSIKHWRRLPQLISHAHVPLLQVRCGQVGVAASLSPPPQLSHQIMELQEALSIHSGLQSGGLNRPPFQTELKTIFKTWK